MLHFFKKPGFGKKRKKKAAGRILRPAAFFWGFCAGVKRERRLLQRVQKPDAELHHRDADGFAQIVLCKEGAPLWRGGVKPQQLMTIRAAVLLSLIHILSCWHWQLTATAG